MTARIDARVRSVETRIDGFARQLDDYSAQPSAGRKGPAAALAVVSTYVPWLRKRVQEEVQASTDGPSLLAFLQTVVFDLFDASDFIADWFSEANVRGVPPALFESVTRECGILGIGPRQAVLAIGPSHEFQTAPYELSELLFRGITAGAVPDGMPDTKFALIRMPRVEANSSLWWPAILGHEVAHIKVRQADLTRFWLPDREEFQQLVVPPERRKETLQRAQMWIRELVCDAYAVKRFGPAAAAAIVEILDHRGAVPMYSDSHPPAWLRATVMCEWLSTLQATNALAPLLDQAMEIATSAQPTAVPPFELMYGVVPLLVAMAPEFMEFVETWGTERYDASVGELRAREGITDLSHGIPPRIEALADHPSSADADIANAAWAAYLSDVTWPVQRLATKSMDDLVFLRSWLETGGFVGMPEVEKSSNIDATAVNESALSRNAIATRLALDWRDHRKLVATPLLGKPLGDASLDVRLGNRFIVFERTDMPSIRTLARQLDSRRVQRRHEVGWGHRFVLHPGELVLASTLEFLVMPGDLVAQVVTRSSYGRMGLICATAVEVHPLYRGCLTLELLNLGVAPLEIAPGERIAQLIFWRAAPVVSEPADPDRTCPTGPEFTRPRVAAEDAVMAEILQVSIAR